MDGRLTWVLGNWKQNKLRAEATELAAAVAAGLDEALGGSDRVRAGIAPTFTALEAVRPSTGTDPRELHLLSQDIAAQDSGAFTGEIGPEMLRDVGVSTAIIGHSERRAYFGEQGELLSAKLNCALSGGLTAILCVGEQLEDRDAGRQKDVVISQLSEALLNVDSSALPRLVVAYEPVWAIGTGRTASPEQASEMHGAIRTWLGDRLGQDAGLGNSIIYGGSVKPGNAADLLAAGNIDGFLVGGASLDAASFLDIVRAAGLAESR